MQAKLERTQASSLQLEKLYNDEREKSTALKGLNQELTKRVDTLKAEVLQESQNSADASDRMEGMRRDYESRIAEQDAKLQHMHDKLAKLAAANDEKDLEVSRLRRETEEQGKSNKSNNEKLIKYQAANEKIRKDKTVIEEKFKELQKQFLMHQ